MDPATSCIEATGMDAELDALELDMPALQARARPVRAGHRLDRAP